MRIPILNRDFQHPADGWYQIEAKGNHPNAAAKVVQVIDDAATASIANRFNAEAAKPGFAGMLIDREHFKHDPDKDTIAYGWLTAVQNRPDGLYGQIRWTDTGRKAVDGGDYRFFSTEYDPADLEIINDKKPRQVRPLRLDGLTLTNMNNNKGQKPITNRSTDAERQIAEIILNAEMVATGEEAAAAARKILNGDFPGHEFHGNQYVDGAPVETSSNRLSQAAHDATRTALRTGSAKDDAWAASLHRQAAAKANKEGNKALTLYHDEMAEMHLSNIPAKNREFPTGSASADHPQSQLTENKMKKVLKHLGLAEDADETAVLQAVTQLTKRSAELENQSIDADMEIYKNRFDPKQRDFIKSMLVANRAATIDFLKGQPEIKGAVAPGRIHSRETAQPVDKGAANAASEADEAEQSRLRVKAINDYKVTNRGCTHAQATNAVRRDNPELFGLPKR